MNRILQGVQAGLMFVCAAGLIGSSLLVVAQVLNRYWLHFEIMWFGDVALYAFILFMLFAAPLTTWQQGHVGVDYFHETALRKKPRGVAIRRVCIGVISIALACVVLSPAYKFMLRALKFPEHAALVPWFNISWLHVALFFALALVLIYLLVIARRDISDLIKVYRRGTGEDK